MLRLAPHSLECLLHVRTGLLIVDGVDRFVNTRKAIFLEYLKIVLCTVRSDKKYLSRGPLTFVLLFKWLDHEAIIWRESSVVLRTV